MKLFLSFSLILFVSLNSFSQSLSDKSKEELQSMKKEAVAAEDYNLATKIKNELKTRVSIDEKIVSKNTALETAIAAEDYSKAELLNKEIEKLKINKVKIEALKEERFYI